MAVYACQCQHFVAVAAISLYISDVKVCEGACQYMPVHSLCTTAVCQADVPSQHLQWQKGNCSCQQRLCNERVNPTSAGTCLYYVHTLTAAAGRGQAFAGVGGTPMLVGVVEDWVRGVRSQLLQWSARLLGQEQWQPYSSAQVRTQPSSMVFCFK